MRIQNDTSKAGQIAKRKTLFGDCSRYAVAPVHSRLGALQWFVWDADNTDALTGNPAVIRQEDSLEAAMRDFMGEPGASKIAA